MWPKSKPYNQENLDEAMSYVTANFSADMGGTELLPGLRRVVQKRNPAFKTQIIVLTDGEDWNTANTLDFIRDTKSVKGNEETRFFALEIGHAVSHRLIEGIGRYGGGLAEVVSVSSTGDWKGRIIRMLEAALTPSTWKVEITLDDVLTTANAEERIFVRAPHHIPDLHAFSRFSVSFLFSQELKAKKVKVKATATSGETVTTELPIQKLEYGRTYTHQLAAKTVVNDLESYQSWLHDISQKKNGECMADAEGLARAEGEKIALSGRSQAEKTDLADLTRTRFGVTNYSAPDRNAAYFDAGGYYGGGGWGGGAHGGGAGGGDGGDYGGSYRIELEAIRPDATEVFAATQLFPQLKRQRIMRETILQELMSAQTAEGSFKLGRELYTALKAEFKHWRFDLLVSELGEDLLFDDLDKVLETA